MKNQNVELVFLSGKRTPFAAYGGSFRDLNPSELGTAASIAALHAAKVEPARIQHLIFGSVLQSTSDAIYTSRHIGLKSGVPIEVPALAINRLCGSGFQVLIEAYQQMLAGDAEVCLVGGVENMSVTPFVVRKARWGSKLGHQELEDYLFAALTDSYTGCPMAITAENLAEKNKISRDEVDAYAFLSQQRAKQADLQGAFVDELVAFKNVSKDEHPKPETTLEGLAKLKPVFKSGGVVTAGTASGIVDGAAAMVVSTSEYAEKNGLSPLGRMISYAVVGVDPAIMGIGPVPAIKQALKRAGMTLSQMDFIEVNEAFSAQYLAVEKELGLDRSKTNVHGGAIAIGHPLAASGTRLTIHLLNTLRLKNKKFGVASACIGGGQGIAVVVEAF